MLVRMNTKTCHYCKQERPTESFVSLRKCAECAATRKCYTCGQQKPIQDFPEGFQILCFNCNAGKHRNGGRCPHEQLAESHCRERD